MANCNYKVNIKDIQSKYSFKIFCSSDNAEIQAEIGNLEDLTTTAKNNLVSAINEVHSDTETNATAISGLQSSKEDKSNKVTTLSSMSTDTQYPSAKAVYDSQETQDETISTLETNLEETQEELDYYKTIYNVLPKVSGNGESITLDNTGESILKLDLKGNTSQYSTTGKNKLNNNITTETNRGIEFKTEGTGIKCSGTATSTYAQMQQFVPINLESGTYTLEYSSTSQIPLKVWLYDSNETIIGTLEKDTQVSITTNATKYRFFITDIVVNTQYNEVYKDIMITLSSQSGGEYEPFTNGASPNPDYPQVIHTINGDNTIKVYGKNLFDKNTPKTNYYYDGSGNQVPSSQTYINQEIPLSNKYTISFSVNHSSNVRIVEFGNNDTFINRTLINTTPNTITTNANTKKVIVCVDYDTSQNKYFENLMIEAGESASAYEPYKQNAVLLTLGDTEICKIGNYEDKIFKAIKGNEIYDSLSVEEKNTLDYGKWYLQKNIGKVVLNGSEDIAREQISNNYYKFYINNISNVDYGDTNYIPKIMSDKLVAIGRTTMYLNTQGITSANNSLQIYTDATKLMTISDVRTWLGSNNIIAYYGLTTPTYEKFNDTIGEQLEDIYFNMLSYEGQTNISQVNNDAPFKIYASALMKISGE